MPEARLQLRTYKDGLLARLAHDLLLLVPGVRVELADGRVEVEVDASTVRVEGVPANGRIMADALSARDRRTIEASIVPEVLGAHPIRFEGQVAPDGRRVDGRLTLHGRTLPLSVPVRATADRLEVALEIVPSRWGIAPYRALGGAIRLQDRWGIAAHLPWSGGSVTNARARWAPATQSP